MEFGEKLQQLRTARGLTQEQLAEKLYVSRTALSKWEVGRGYPNLSSLKQISIFFGVTIDDLLSEGELISLAEENNKNSLQRLGGAVFAALDLFAVLLLFLPLCGQERAGDVYVVSLLNGSFSAFFRVFGICFLSCLFFCGILRLFSLCLAQEKADRFLQFFSLCLHVLITAFFMLARQPYLSVVLFGFLIVKTFTLYTVWKKVQ